MPKYVLACQGGGTPESAEEGRAVMAAWGARYDNLGAEAMA